MHWINKTDTMIYRVGNYAVKYDMITSELLFQKI